MDIKNIPVGITKLRKGGKDSVIIGCESKDEKRKLKETVCEKMGENFEIMEPRRIKPKIKIINIGKEEMEIEDENLVETIRKQNMIDGKKEELHIKVVKKIMKDKSEENTRTRGGDKDRILILEVDKKYTRTYIKEKKNKYWMEKMSSI